MEEFLPFVFGIAFFIYKTYKNFRDEQEKARKRNLSRPVQYEEDPEDLYIPQQHRSDEREPVLVPEPLLVKEIPNPNNRYEPKYQPMYRESYTQTSGDRSYSETSYREGVRGLEMINPEEPAEEVTRGRAIHAKHPHKVEVYQQEEEVPFEFDMQDAIIKEAILNRPQH